MWSLDVRGTLRWTSPLWSDSSATQAAGVSPAYGPKVNFLMSGEPAVRVAIAALAAKGHKGVHLTFNAHSPWLSLTWLSVHRDDSRDGAAAIARTVLRVDPRALRI